MKTTSRCATSPTTVSTPANCHRARPARTEEPTRPQDQRDARIGTPSDTPTTVTFPGRRGGQAPSLQTHGAAGPPRPPASRGAGSRSVFGQRRGEQVVGGPVEVVAAAVVAAGGARVGVAEGVLDVLQRCGQA